MCMFAERGSIDVSDEKSREKLSLGMKTGQNATDHSVPP